MDPQHAAWHTLMRSRQSSPKSQGLPTTSLAAQSTLLVHYEDALVHHGPHGIAPCKNVLPLHLAAHLRHVDVLDVLL